MPAAFITIIALLITSAISGMATGDCIGNQADVGIDHDLVTLFRNSCCRLLDILSENRKVSGLMEHDQRSAIE
jgi:hypothetical protein